MVEPKPDDIDPDVLDPGQLGAMRAKPGDREGAKLSLLLGSHHLEHRDRAGASTRAAGLDLYDHERLTVQRDHVHLPADAFDPGIAGDDAPATPLELASDDSLPFTAQNLSCLGHGPTVGIAGARVAFGLERFGYI